MHESRYNRIVKFRSFTLEELFKRPLKMDTEVSAGLQLFGQRSPNNLGFPII